MRLTPPDPIQGPIPPALRKHNTCWLTDNLLTLFFPFFLNVILPKFLGNALIMSHYWKLVPHLCKESGVPTMLGVLSLPFINYSIPLIYPPFFKICHPRGKMATINQLIKIDISIINYSEENEIILTY